MESPASWNTRYRNPDGFDCQLTLRGETGSEVLAKAEAALTWLKEHGCTPLNGFAGKPAETPQPEPPMAEDWCPIHQCKMARHEKDGHAWFSHKGPDGDWCRGKRKD